MKSLVKLLMESYNSKNKLNESKSLSEYCVRFVKVNGDAGIMFEGEDGEYEPDDVKALCDAVGYEYSNEGYDDVDVPVYFWNITRNSGYWVSRGRCKDVLSK